MENLKSLFGAIIIIFIFSGCGLTIRAPVYRTVERSQSVDEALIGNYQSTEGLKIDLATERSMIQVVMFVSETCAVCRRETKTLVAHLAEFGIPTNVAFHSIVVGSTIVDAAYWKSGLKVSWSVGVDEGDSIFRNYCAEGQTPCILLHNPISNTIQKLVGEHSITEWKNFTGEWRYP